MVSDADLWDECQRKQTLTIASDGGLKGRQGTFGWVLSTHRNKILAEGAGPIDGPFDTSSSTRSELGGYAASLLFCLLYFTRYGANDINATFGLIRQETVNLRRTITPVWVKGHQRDSSRSVTRRSHDIQCNNRADELATWYREHPSHRQSVEHTEHTPESRVSISINGLRLTSQIEESLRFHINGYHLRQYIQSRQRWPDQVWQRVDFEAFGSFHRRLTSSEQIAHTKFIFDQWHTGKQRYNVATIKDAKLQLCPCCRTVIETSTHVIRCQQNPDHATALKEFRRRMSPEEYHPVFQFLKDDVIAWIEDREFHPMLTDFSGEIRDSLRVALRDQTQIGWDNAIKGYLSVAWRDTAQKSLYGNSLDSQAGRVFTMLSHFESDASSDATTVEIEEQSLARI
ncbi:hypothetical protein MHU86_2302 [Fragilaria crotonensis]|nr:hypothetical protein MHU86_2302 [Fragilaria crotonensis]